MVRCLGSAAIGGAGGAAIKSIQHVILTTSGTTATATTTISSVVVANSFVVYEGSTANDAAANSLFSVDLTNATTVTATRGITASTVATIHATVIEYEEGQLNSIQAGSDNISGSGGSFAITSVDTARSQIFRQGFTTSSTTAFINPNIKFNFGSSTSVSMSRASGSSAAVVAFFVAVELN